MINECGSHSFSRITRPLINKILNALRANGAIVMGNNPWTVDTEKHGVILSGSWDEKNSSLLVSVQDKDFLVPCGKIWETVVPLILKIRDSENPPIV